MEWREVASWILIVPGALFCVIGGIGMVRMPEFYTRMHASGIIDTLGAAFLLVGLMLQPADWNATLKLAVILFFLTITVPTAAHAVIHAAHASGYEPKLAEGADEEVAER